MHFVYILASESRELYIGVTNDLSRRVAEHRSGLSERSRGEKELKLLNRQKKLSLIEWVNREWRDLAEG